MGGGLMQLVAYGAQDIYLTGNPQITFFKVVYRRHTNFSIETIKQTISGSSKLSSGSTSAGTVTIARNGDLVSDVYVTSESENIIVGDEIINKVELEIGGQLIDKQEHDWMAIWNELTIPMSKQLGYSVMTGTVGQTGTTTGDKDGVRMVHLPLNFWFCRNPGLALPLIALQYHEVKLMFTWGDKDNVINNNETNDIECKVYCDYIYLDTDERRRFAQVSHEYLIEQIQVNTIKASSGSHKLTLNHPIKELIWTSKAPTTGVDSSFKTYSKAKLILNGQDRFSEQFEEYFQLRQPFKYHTSIPGTNMPKVIFSEENNHNSNHPQIGGHNGARDIDIFTGNQSHRSTALTIADSNASLDVNSGTFQVFGYDVGATLDYTRAITASTTLLNLNDTGSGATKQIFGSVTPVTTDGIQIGLVFSFLTSDLQIVPSAGDVIHINSSEGGDKVLRPDNSDNNFPLTVQNVFQGQTNGGGNSNTTHITFDIASNQFRDYFSDKRFVDALNLDFSDVSTSGIDLAINSISVLRSGHAHTSSFRKRINCYSFALKPEEHQPSGTCNFSRIDDARLYLESSPGEVSKLYAVNYNVLRIMSGMGGLAYSN